MDQAQSQYYEVLENPRQAHGIYVVPVATGLDSAPNSGSGKPSLLPCSGLVGPVYSQPPALHHPHSVPAPSGVSAVPFRES